VPSAPLPNELDIVRDLSLRLERGGVPFMLTGSLAMSYYAEPRMTRDVDVIIAVEAADVSRIVGLLEADYYVDAAAVAEAIAERTSFNAIHREGVVKVDCFPRKADPFHMSEFARRRRVRIDDFDTVIVTREDLIVAKLLWSRESRSALQLRDVKNLLAGAVDHAYLNSWAGCLNLADALSEAQR
jgi:hypothetical protein